MIFFASEDGDLPITLYSDVFLVRKGDSPTSSVEKNPNDVLGLHQLGFQSVSICAKQILHVTH